MVNDMQKLLRYGLYNRVLSVLLAITFSIAGSICPSAQTQTTPPQAGGSSQSIARPVPLSSTADNFVTVYGAKIHYVEAGTGPVVILLHGLGADISSWDLTIGQLSQKYRVIVPDQIGFGRSDKPLINYRIGTLVDFLDGFYKELKVEHASLVGNSLGGWVAAAFALAHPEKVERSCWSMRQGIQYPKTLIRAR
jgi:hypothetical protein